MLLDLQEEELGSFILRSRRTILFTCRSLILDPRYDIPDVDLIKPSWYIETTDVEGIKKISKYIDDRNYIEGVILLAYNNENIFTYRDWDDVNYWWMYITLAIQMVLDEGEGWLYMPDQPTKITFKERDNDLIEMYTEWNDKTYILPEKELLTTLLEGSIQFFEAIDEPLELHGEYNDEIQFSKDLLLRVENKFKKLSVSNI